MKQSILIFVLGLGLSGLTFGQRTIADKRLLPIRIWTMSGDTLTGFMTQFNNQSVWMHSPEAMRFEPVYAETYEIPHTAIDSISIRGRHNFLDGLANYGALTGAAILLPVAASNPEDELMILVGGFMGTVCGLAVGTTAGIINQVKYLREGIQVNGNSAAFVPYYQKLKRNSQSGKVTVRDTDRGRRLLAEFDKDLSSLFSRVLLSVDLGVIFSSTGKGAIADASGHEYSNHSSGDQIVVWMGIGYAFQRNWQTVLFVSSRMYDYGYINYGEFEGTLDYSFQEQFTDLVFYWRPKPFTYDRKTGFQLALGAGPSLNTLKGSRSEHVVTFRDPESGYHEYLSSYSVDKKKVVPGLVGSVRLDAFLSRYVSIVTELDGAIYTPIEVDGSDHFSHSEQHVVPARFNVSIGIAGHF